MKQDFIIITQPRSGDEILISQLRSHPNIYITLGKPLRDFIDSNSDASFPGFLLDKYNTQNYEIKLKEQDIMHSLNTRQYMEEYYEKYFKLVEPAHGERDLVKLFLDKIYSKDKTQKEEGYKLATEYAYKRYKINGLTTYIEDLYTDVFTKKWNIWEETVVPNSELKIIFLFRKNLLWRNVSAALPVTVNDHGYTKIEKKTCILNKQQLIEDISLREQEQIKIKEHISKLGLQSIEIYYEDLIDKNRETLDKVQTFLKMPIQEKDLFGINVHNIFEETRPLETVLTNYNELKQQCPELSNFFEMAEKSINPFYYEIRKAGTFASLEFLQEMVDGMDTNLHDPYKNKQNINTISCDEVDC